MIIPLDTQIAVPLYVQIANYVTQLATSGQLRAQDKLPSTRELAQGLNVHRSTVVNAYDELRARGVIVSLHGSGSFVADGLSARAVPYTQAIRLKADNANPSLEYWTDEIYRLNQRDDLISLGLGLPAEEFFPIDEWERLRAQVIRREGARTLGYVEPPGFYPLRRAIARDVARHGIRCDAEDIIVTSGAQEALSLVMRALAKTGDTVLTELPAFFGTLLAMKRLGLNAVGFGQTECGPNWHELVHALNQSECNPRFVSVVPDYSNPTGLQWAADERYKFLQWANEHDMTVVEDATYRDMRFEGAAQVPLRALNADVLYIGSFSKSLMPGIRMGYVVANGALREQLITLKHVSSGSSESLSQRVLTEYLLSDAYVWHLDKVNAHYLRRRNAALNAMAQFFPNDANWTQPTGAFYTWVTLPPRIPANVFFQRALQQGIVVAPAGLFFPSQLDGVPNCVRLCFARYSEQALVNAVQTLGALMQ